MRTGVLVSGSGTNLQALIDAHAAAALGPARLVVVGSNRPGCGGIARARAAGLDVFEIDHRGFADRADFDRAVRDRLRSHGVELLVMAGFMRVVGAELLDGFAAVVNVHPSLLPSFPGVHAQKQAFDHGVKITGCTVHFVDAGVDTGPIIAQAAVPILDGDDAEAVRLRILAEEHRLLPAAVRAIAEGRVTREGRRVTTRPPAEPTSPAPSRSPSS